MFPHAPRSTTVAAVIGALALVPAGAAAQQDLRAPDQVAGPAVVQAHHGQDLRAPDQVVGQPRQPQDLRSPDQVSGPAPSVSPSAPTAATTPSSDGGVDLWLIAGIAAAALVAAGTGVAVARHSRTRAVGHA